MGKKLFLEKTIWKKALSEEKPFSDLPSCDRAIRRHLSVAIETVLGKPPQIVDRISREEFRQIISAVNYVIFYVWNVSDLGEMQEDWYEPQLKNAGGGTFMMCLVPCPKPDDK